MALKSQSSRDWVQYAVIAGRGFPLRPAAATSGRTCDGTAAFGFYTSGFTWSDLHKRPALEIYSIVGVQIDSTWINVEKGHPIY